MMRISILGLLIFLLCRSVSASPCVSVGFSPEGSARQLVLENIHAAKNSIRLMGYSFTAPDIVNGLIFAYKQGVDVKLVLDSRGNKHKTSQAAMKRLVHEGIPIRTVSKYPIMHDKVVIVDKKIVQTGSFNFSRAAERKNSENVIVFRCEPELAKQYLMHWMDRWEKGSDYES